MIQTSRANGPYTWAGVSASGPTESLQLQGASEHSLQAVLIGSPTATFRLEGSLDGNNFFDLSGTLPASPFTSTNSSITHITYKPVCYVRVNVLSYSGSGSLALSYLGV